MKLVGRIAGIVTGLVVSTFLALLFPGDRWISLVAGVVSLLLARSAVMDADGYRRSFFMGVLGRIISGIMGVSAAIVALDQDKGWWVAIAVGLGVLLAVRFVWAMFEGWALRREMEELSREIRRSSEKA